MPRGAVVQAVDLFCGAGGLAYGLERAGVDVRAGYDVDSACKHAYEANTSGTFHQRDVAMLTADSLAKEFHNGFSLLAGCAPCQPFSLMNRNRMSSSDGRWTLLRHFARLAKAFQPDFVTMENVPGLEKTPIFQDFLAVLKRKEYQTAFQVIPCSQLGVPQKRQRLVLIASRVGPATLPEIRKKGVPTVRK